MSNPYEPPPPPPGGPQQPPPAFPPYAAPGGPGGPGGPWGPGPAPFSYPTAPQTDAVSITGFVLSLTFCLSFVGVILGLVGLARTKGGKRKGRWAAVSAIAVGVVATGLTVLFAVIIGVQVASVISPDEARAGQCVDLDDDPEGLTFTETGCDEAHDAEIVQVGRVADQDPTALTGPEDLCRAEMPQSALDAVDAAGDLDWSVATEDPTDPQPSDRYLCYVEAASGKLDSPILGG